MDVLANLIIFIISILLKLTNGNDSLMCVFGLFYSTIWKLKIKIWRSEIQNHIYKKNYRWQDVLFVWFKQCGTTSINIEVQNGYDFNQIINWLH